MVHELKIGTNSSLLGCSHNAMRLKLENCGHFISDMKPGTTPTQAPEAEIEITEQAGSAQSDRTDGFSTLSRIAVGHGMFLVGVVLLSRGDLAGWLYTAASTAFVVVAATLMHNYRACAPVEAAMSGPRAGLAETVLLAIVLGVGIAVGHAVAYSCIVASFVVMPRTVQTPYLSRYFNLAKSSAPLWVLVAVIKVDVWVTAVILVGCVLGARVVGYLFDSVMGPRVFSVICQQGTEWAIPPETRAQFRHAALVCSVGRTALLVYYFMRVNEAGSAYWLGALAATTYTFGVMGEVQFSHLGPEKHKTVIVWACAWLAVSSVVVVVLDILRERDVIHLVALAAVDAFIVFPVTGMALREVMEKDEHSPTVIYKERAADTAVALLVSQLFEATRVAPNPFVAALLVYLYHHMDGHFSPAGRRAARGDDEHTGQSGGSGVPPGEQADNFSAVSDDDGVEEEAGDDFSQGSDTEVVLDQ